MRCPGPPCATPSSIYPKTSDDGTCIPNRPGKKGEGMVPVVYHEGYVVPLPKGHRFPMPKFGIIHDILCDEGITTLESSRRPDLPDRRAVELVHRREYLDAFVAGDLDPRATRRIGLPWSETLVERTFRAVGGTILTARLALETGVACNSAGGTHHAHPGFGSGFCILNDLAVTARLLLEEGSVQRVLIVDLDVHQGDGTAVALADRPELFTFSMHCGSNFPFRKAESDLDIPLRNNLGDDEYLNILESYLPSLLDELSPDLLLYDAGVDVCAGDRLGRLSLSREGIAKRDRYVLAEALSREIPVATVIGGGYDLDLRKLSDRHATVHRAATGLLPAS